MTEEKNIERRMKIQQYKSENRDKVNAYKKKRRQDPAFRIKTTMSKRVTKLLHSKGKGKKSSFLKAVGYTLDDLRQHLESHFVDNMGWHNYGTEWVVDHYVPHILFDYDSTEEVQFRICWSLDNLYPLDWNTNNRKNDTIPSFDYDDINQKKF